MGDTGEGSDLGMGGEAVGRPGGRNPLGVSRRAALCSHTVLQVLRAWRVPQEEQPRKAQTPVPCQGCSAEPSHPVLPCTPSSPSMEVTMVNTFAAPLK